MTIRFFKVFILISTLLSATGAPGQTEESTEAGRETGVEAESPWPGLSSEDFGKTAELFSKKCAICHELDGMSDDPLMNLVDETWSHGDRLDDIEDTIRKGVPGTDMDAFQDTFDDQTIANLAMYIKYLGHQVHIQNEAMRFDAASRANQMQDTSGDLDSDRYLVSSPDLSELPELQSIQLVPEGIDLNGLKASQRLRVSGKFADGIERDLTGIAEFSLSNDQVVELRHGCSVRSLADGSVTLTATVEELSDRSEIRVEASQTPQPFSFPRHIGAILTSRGCNATSCHAGVKGRGGFKLSLSVLSPETDYKWILEGGGYQVLTDEVVGPRVPRIDTENPEDSLLLLKPTLSVSHKGGKRIDRDSEDYQTLLDWIRRGAPFEEEGAEQLAIEELEIQPRSSVLQQGATFQILVTGHLVNGQTEDLTDQVRFESNNPEVVTVSPGGLVKAQGLGETDILVWASGIRSQARFAVIGETVEDYPDVPRNNLIDEHVFAKLQQHHIIPSTLTEDSEFLRRVCLDLTGTLPPPSRVREWLDNDDPNKREKLIDTLMESPEYTDYWIYRFSDFFRVRFGGPIPRGEIYWDWMRKNIVANRPYDEIVWERIAGQGIEGAACFHQGDITVAARSSEDARVFLGRRFDCAECHDHPTEIWTQEQFWGLAAFYGKMTFVEFGILYDDPDGHEYPYGDEGIETLAFQEVKNPRNQTVIPPTFLDGTTLPEDKADDPRKELADWVVSHPYFAETIVNRIWSHFFYRGIVDPVDDFSSKNLPSHPDLLRALAKDFRENGHDIKRTIRLIVSSRAYQLSSIPNDSNHHDRMNFSNARPRPLDAEILLDAIATVTGIPPVFDRSLAPISGFPHGKAPKKTKAVQLMDSLSYPSRFLEVYGRPTRISVPERKVEPNLAQALHLWVGETYVQRLGLEGGRLHRLLEEGANLQAIIEEFYLAALSRFPTEQEKKGIEEYFGEKSSLHLASFFATNPQRKEMLEDFIWGLITSREFVHNH